MNRRVAVAVASLQSCGVAVAVGVAPHDIRIGMPVRVVFDDITDEVTLPKFAPA